MVYAKLASYTPGRPSFLFESRATDSEAGRYSLVGYRAMRGEGIPPNMDAIGAWFETTDEEGPEQLAEAIVKGTVGFAPACAAYREHGLLLYPDEYHGSTFTRGSTVILFDHHEKRAVVAGPVAGRAVERLIWELEHGPDIDEPLALAEAAAAHHAQVGREKVTARAKRVLGFLADELEEVVLADTLVASAGGALALEVYRCWRQHNTAAAGFFLDFGDPPPQQQQLAVFGFSSQPLYVDRAGENGAKKVLDQLPHRSMSGVPNILAAKVARRLEENSRGLWGGVVGYVGQGGGAALYLAEQVMVLDSGTFWLTGGSAIRQDREVASAIEQLYAQHDVGLRAIEAARLAAPPEEEPADGAEQPTQAG